MEKIKLMIVGSGDRRVYDVKNLIKSEDMAVVGVARLGDGALEKVASIRPDVVLMQCGDAEESAIALSGLIYTKLPGCCVLALCDSSDISVIDRAMLAGVRKVLTLPIEADILSENIRLAYDIEKTRQKNSGGGSIVIRSKVITVFGAKGGIGKTTITANLAVLLSRTGKRVAVIDTDLQFGDINVFFDVDAKDTIAELSQGRDAADIDAVKRAAVLHHSGVSIICAPKSPEYAEYVTARSIETIISTMRPHYDYILVDTAPVFNDTTIAAIENSNTVVLVSGMDISTLRNTKTSLGILDSLRQSDKVELVINKSAGGIISIKDVQNILGLPVKNRISYDMKTALTSHNKGIPLVLDAPRSTIAGELSQLAKSLTKSLDGAI